MRKSIIILGIVCALAILAYKLALHPLIPTKVELNPNPQTTAEKIVNGAKLEVTNYVRYDASYETIPYPNGDVSKAKGACTDVVIRALRNAGYDLQKLVHEDMKKNFDLYPKMWELRTTDPNIDHRRVPNLMVFFRRFGKVLPKETNGNARSSWKPGDIVCWDLNGNGLTHTGIISDVKNDDGLPLVIHNMGPVAAQSDCLNDWKIIGHYRYPK